MPTRLTPENIIANLDYYTELVAKRAELDRMTATGQTHDVAEYVGAVYDLPGLEAALLDAGVFRWSADEVITWARRKV